MVKPSHSFRSPNARAAASFVESGETITPLASVPALVAPEAVSPPTAPAADAASPVVKAVATRAPRHVQARTDGRKTSRRADGREMRKQTIHLEAALSRRLAIHCAGMGIDISEVVAAALETHLEK